MKKILILLFATTTIISCQTPEKKAQAAIKEYLKRNLNDASSYEPVDFGPLDSNFSKINYTDSAGIKHVSDEPFFHGYKMIHSYRARNGFGALILNTEYFHVFQAGDKWFASEYHTPE